MNDDVCEHLEALRDPPRPDYSAGCPACLAMGSRWVHLRYCDACGNVGCCNDSPNRHATAHAHESGHPVFRSLEPGENWAWCVPDDMGVMT